MNQLINKLPAIVFSLFISFISETSYSEPPNLTHIKNEIKNYHDSGLYQKEIALVLEEARQYIIYQTYINEQKKLHQKLAVVLDIDETSLSNYKYMIKRDFTGTREQFHQDIMEANAPAIKSTLALYQEALERGIKVFFVTGRPESDRNATRKNLLKAGYTHWAGLYLRPDDYSSKSIVPFKSHTRELITQKGYTIVASIGDQSSDLKGGFAKKGFKLPNPYYYLP